MKILALNLRAFGPFTDVALDLSEGSEGLHLVYGPNEAGKTSALRALEQLLFGIPGNSADNFVHSYPKLRIGATLLASDGRRLEFLRRKGTKRTLLASDDQPPLDEADLQHFLGGLDRLTFSTMFGIGHQRLREGGRDMAQGGGQLGRSLFGAGAGIANLRAVQESLGARADKLFMPRGSRPAINRCLAELKAARKALREAELPAARWLQHEKALEEAKEQLERVEKELAEQSRQRSRYERIRDAVPLVARRKGIVRQQDELGGVRILPDDFADQRRDADATLRAARKNEETARHAIERIDAQLAAIVIPEHLVAEADSIEDLYQRLGSHRKAQGDRPALLAQRDQLERDARRILRELDPKLSLEFADRLRLTSRAKVEIQNLGSRYEALVGDLAQAQENIDQYRSELAEVEAALAELPAPRDPAALQDAVRRTQAHGDLEHQLAAARADRDRREEQAAVDLQKLPVWSGSLEELERLAVPSAETLDRFEDRLTECDRQLALVRRDRQEAERRAAECESQLDQLRGEGDVPTEEELAEARKTRDARWRLVLKSWQSGKSNADLAAAFEHAVGAADRLADRLRREASRVARLAEIRASRQKTRRELEELGAQETHAQKQRLEAETAWNACWQPLGVVPRTPREMRSWVQRQQALASQAEAIRTAAATVASLEDRIGRFRQELGDPLRALEEPAESPGESLGAMLGRCQAVVDRLEAVADRRELLTADRARLTRSVAAAEAARSRAQEEMAQWRDLWATAIEPLSLPPETTPAATNEVLARIDELFDCLKQVEGLSDRIEGIDRDAAQFQQEVRKLVDRVAPELGSQPLDRQVQEVYARLQEAIRVGDKLEAQQSERSRRLAELEEAQKAVTTQTARLDAMCQEAGCSEHEALAEAIQRSARAKKLGDDLAQVNEQLLHLAGGAAVEGFSAEVETVDADALPAQLDHLGQEIERLEAEAKSVREAKAREATLLETLDTSAAAADAEEERQHLLARIESEAREYARLRLASAVLSEAMERYRKKNEDPILRRASELFGRLTLGSFASLRTDVDSSGNDVLAGIRAGGTTPVHLDGMSEGTCDQLYLALRLASLEVHLERGEPIPLVVDDVLISFDDERATAALSVLADLSQRTQVIFFTHHRHLVRLAEARLDREALFVHGLPERDMSKS